MKFILIIFVALFVLSEVESGKLKVCVPKKKKNTKVEISFDETLRKTSQIPESFVLNGTYKFNITSGDIRGPGYFKDIEVSNYLNYSLCIFQGLTTPLNITIHKLKIRGEYNVTLDISELFDMYGDGEFELDLEGFSFAVDHLSAKWPLGRCYGIDLGECIQKMTANFTNLMGGDPTVGPILNKVIGDMGTEVMNEVWPPIYKMLIPSLQDFLDKHINNIELGNFLDVFIRRGTDLKSQKINCWDFPNTNKTESYLEENRYYH